MNRSSNNSKADKRLLQQGTNQVNLSKQYSLIELYKLPQMNRIFTQIEPSNLWKSEDWAERKDNIVLQSQETIEFIQNVNQKGENSDYLVDLYHYKEVLRLLTLENIRQLKQEFMAQDTRGVNLEEFVLLLLKIISIEQPKHIQFLINGTRLLYYAITQKYNESWVTFDSLLNFYFVGQLLGSSLSSDQIQGEQTGDQEPNKVDLKALKEFEELKKNKFVLFSSATQDVVHHDAALKNVQFAEEFGYLFSLDEQSDNFRVYNSQTLNLMRKVSTDSSKHKVKVVKFLDIHWSKQQKILGACCQDQRISFWIGNHDKILNLRTEYSFTCEPFGIQTKIFYIEIINVWITISQHNRIIEWKFINEIDQSKGTSVLKNLNSNKQLVKKTTFIENKTKPQDQEDQQKSGGPVFTNISVAVGKEWNFNPKAPISFIKEIAAIYKLMIATFDKTITIWNLRRHCVFVKILIPDGFSSAHQIAYSHKMNLIFSAGFDQSILIWALDEVNEDYNKIGRIGISEPGVSVSALECFDEYGILISVDEIGMIRCWDLEKGKIAYRISLGYRINNVLSQIVRLEIGRFVVVTSRLHMFEFPLKQPREVKSKFQPLQTMLYNEVQQRILVSSQKQLIIINVNNAIVEEIYTTENSTMSKQIVGYFDSVLQGQLYTIDNTGCIHHLNHNFQHNEIKIQDSLDKMIKDFQKGIKESNQDISQVKGQKKMVLFENEKMEGYHYQWSYDMLCAWTNNAVKVFQGSQKFKIKESNEQAQFYSIRQINYNKCDQDIQEVKIMPERDILVVLFKSGVLEFINFSNLLISGHLSILKTINQTEKYSQYDEDLIQFENVHLVCDYDMIVLFGINKDLWFVRHSNFKKFQVVCQIKAVSLLPQNIIFKIPQQSFFCNLNIHQLQEQSAQAIIVDFIVQKQNRQNIKLINELKETNTDPFYKFNPNYNFLDRIIELQKNVNTLDDSSKSKRNSRQIFIQTVQKVMLAIKDNRSLLYEMMQNNSDVPSVEPSNYTTNGQEYTEDSITISAYEELYTDKLSNILENFISEYYLSMSNVKGRVVFINLGDFLIKNFNQIKGEYLNQNINQRHCTRLNYVDNLVSLQEGLHPIFNTTQDVIESGIELKHIYAHEGSAVIETQLQNFNDRMVLYTFGAQDNILKASDVTECSFPLKCKIDPNYMKAKSQEIRYKMKLIELQLNAKILDVEQDIIFQKDLLQNVKQRISGLVLQVPSKQRVIDNPIYGEYVLPIEIFIRWNLKQFNKQFRQSQMKPLISLLHKMMQRWIQQNQYLEQMLIIQISQKKKYQKRAQEKNSGDNPPPEILQKKQNKMFIESMWHSTTKLAQLRTQVLQVSEIENVEQEINQVSSNVEKHSEMEQSFKDNILNTSVNISRIQSLNQNVRASSKKQGGSLKYIRLKPNDQSIIKKQKDDNYGNNPNEIDEIRRRWWKPKIKMEVKDIKPKGFHDQLKLFHKGTISLNQKFSSIYKPEPVQVEEHQKEKKRKNKYEVEINRNPVQKVGDRPQLLQINQRAKSSDKLKYLLEYNFQSIGDYQQKQIVRVISDNLKLKTNLNNTEGDIDTGMQEQKTHYMKYFIKDVKETLNINSEYFSDFQTSKTQKSPRPQMMKKMEQLLLMSKNPSNQGFRLKSQSPKIQNSSSQQKRILPQQQQPKMLVINDQQENWNIIGQLPQINEI